MSEVKKKNKTPLLQNEGVQSLLASLLCILVGLLIGFIVLLFINPKGAGSAIVAVIKNFLNYSRASLQIKNLGNTLVKTAPLLMCSLLQSRTVQHRCRRSVCCRRLHQYLRSAGLGSSLVALPDSRDFGRLPLWRDRGCAQGLP